MSTPLAYLLTWTCYGTWLPGDRRGSVDLRRNAPGGEFAPLSDWRRHTQAQRLRNVPIRLDGRQRRIVDRTISDHCTIRRWTLHSANVRTNHVHIVLSCGELHPDIARDQFKACSTRRLRDAGDFPKPTDVWTEDGSSRYLWDSVQLRSAIRYVAEFQGDEI